VLNSLALPLTLTWSAAAPAGDLAPVWVQDLNQRAQLAITQEMQTPAGASDDFWLNLFLQAVFLTVPGYIILQIALPWWTRDRWRKAAWAPLLVTVPMFLFVLFAATAGGSNLAPIWLLLVCPPAFFYLVFLALFFWLKQKRPRPV
jgi:cell division protein FtsW (lipid II flippase)